MAVPKTAALPLGDTPPMHFFKNKTGEPIIHKSIIDYINSIPNYFKEISLKDYLLSKGELEYDANEYYLEGNQGHPNELGCIKWIEYLQPKIDNLFGKSE